MSNLDSSARELETLQSCLAVELLRNNKAIARRRIVKRACNGPLIAKPFDLSSSARARARDSLEEWLEMLVNLAAEIHTLASYASRRSEHFEGYDVAVTCLQRFVALQAAAEALATSPKLSERTIGLLAGLLKSEEMASTLQLLRSRLLSYLTLFSLSKGQHCFAAELSRTLILDGQQGSDEVSEAKVWVFRSLAFAGLGHAPLSLLHLKTFLSLCPSSLSFLGQSAQILRELEKEEGDQGRRVRGANGEEGEGGLIASALHRLLYIVCLNITQGEKGGDNADLKEVSLSDYLPLLSPSLPPLPAPPSSSVPMGERVRQIISAFCKRNVVQDGHHISSSDSATQSSDSGKGKKSLHSLIGKVYANTLLAKLLRQSNSKHSSNKHSSTNSEKGCLLSAQIAYFTLQECFYQAQLLMCERMLFSAKILYSLSLLLADLLLQLPSISPSSALATHSEKPLVHALIAAVVHSSNTNSSDIGIVGKEVVLYIESVRRGSLCNLLSLSSMLSSPLPPFLSSSPFFSSIFKIEIRKAGECEWEGVEKVRGVWYLMTMNRWEEAKSIADQIEEDILTALHTKTKSSEDRDRVARYVNPLPSNILSALFLHCYVAGGLVLSPVFSLSSPAHDNNCDRVNEILMSLLSPSSFLSSIILKDQSDIKKGDWLRYIIALKFQIVKKRVLIDTL